jgi:hypothetical protein
MHEVFMAQPSTSGAGSGAVVCPSTSSSYMLLIWLAMLLSKCVSRHRLFSLSFSPSDIHSFLLH